MNPITLLIVGIIALVVAYYAGLPQPGQRIALVLGWVLVLVGGLLFLLGLLGV